MQETPLPVTQPAPIGEEQAGPSSQVQGGLFATFEGKPLAFEPPVNVRLDMGLVNNLGPGVNLQPASVDFLFYAAANRLRWSGGRPCTVRVVPALVWAAWQDWAATPVPPGTEWDPYPLPEHLKIGVFTLSDAVFIPWFEDGHYSTLFLCNLCAPFHPWQRIGNCIVCVGHNM